MTQDPSAARPDDDPTAPAVVDDIADTPGEMSADARESAGRPERRYQMVLAALAAMALHLLLPSDFVLSPTWIYPVLMCGFLVLLIAGDPGLVDHERGWIRLVTNLMIVLIALSNLFAIYRLVDGILSTHPAYTQNATQLLTIGAIVWATNVIAFALWYWDVDGGGSARRAKRGAWADPAFIWPEMHLEAYMSSGWYRSSPTTSPCPSTPPWRSAPPTCRPSSAGPRCSCSWSRRHPSSSRPSWWPRPSTRSGSAGSHAGADANVYRMPMVKVAEPSGSACSPNRRKASARTSSRWSSGTDSHMPR